jgi:plastocyanin
MKSFNVKLCLFLLSIVAACFYTGCQKQAQETSVEPPKLPATAGSALKVEMKTEPLFVEPGKQVEINLTIKNDKDEPVKDLPFTKENPMRLIAVSQDLSEFYDLRPELSSDGVYRVRHTFPNAGRYTFFLDLVTPDGKTNTQIIGFGVAGDAPPKQELKADGLLTKTVDGLKVEMKTDGEIAAGKPAALNFELSGKTANTPPAELGKNARFIIVSEDLKEFVHADSVKAGETGLGVLADITFPKGGLYKIWAQFPGEGKVVTVPFVVKVTAAEGEIDYSKIEIPKGAIRVTVSKEGFTPKAIEVKAGQHVTLAFIRIDQENCGTEVEFPNLNLKKELPLGKVVTVDIPAEKPGEFNFACGMNMLKGIVMVE